MKISLNWLSDYVELPPSVEDLASQLTMAGLEVEGIELLGENLGGVVVCQVVDCSPHPDAEKLSVTTVEAGQGPIQVVCGAKNFRVGDLVPLATVGAVLPSGKKIEKAKLRGVESSGMLCSGVELGISEESSGLLILEPSSKPGQPIAETLGLKDVVLEINVTPNRGDCLSHLGIAREVAALTGKRLRLPDVSLADTQVERAPADEFIRVRISDFQGCPRYCARVILGAQIGPSPLWMQNRLRAVGVRALSNAVDITNYVLLECGQPLHAFDLDLVEGKEIIVRRASENEKMKTLDGKERTLSLSDLCVCDAVKPSAVAGIMGGAVSEVSVSTQNILLESAYFAPEGIRRTARRLGVHSESAYRFERGVDPEMVVYAQDRAAKLLATFCNAQVASGRVDVRQENALGKKTSFHLRYSKVGELLGVVVAKEKTEQVLKALGFEIQAGEKEAVVGVPSWRMDVHGEADCMEEVARFIGYSNIPPSMPRGTGQPMGQSMSSVAERKVRLALASSGFDEVLNYSFVSPGDLKLLQPGVAPIALKNPLAADQAVMCTTRWAGLVSNLKRSCNRQVEDVRLYEIGRIYRTRSDPTPEQVADEPLVVAGIMLGNRAPLQWGTPRAAIDFYDLKGVVEQLLDAAKVPRLFFESAPDTPMLHPRCACKVWGGENRCELGIMGELHPSVAKPLDLPRGVFVFELSLEIIASLIQGTNQYQGVPRFPAVLRDLAIVLDENVAAGAVEEAIFEAGAGMVEEVVLFDIFRGKGIAERQKSLAYAIRLRASDRTLADDEVAQVHRRMVELLQRRFGAELRA